MTAEQTFADVLPIWRTIREAGITAIVTPALDYVGALEIGALDVRFAGEAQIAGVGETLRRFVAAQEEGVTLKALFCVDVASDEGLVREYEGATAHAARHPATAAYVQGRAAWLRQRVMRKTRVFLFFSEPGVLRGMGRGVLGHPLLFGKTGRFTATEHAAKLKSLLALRDRVVTRLQAAQIRSRELTPDEVWDLHFRILNPTRAAAGVPRRARLEDNVFDDDTLRRVGDFGAAYTEAELLVQEDWEDARGYWRQGSLFRRALTLKVLPEDGTGYYGIEAFLEQLRDAEGPFPYTLSVTVDVLDQRKVKGELARRHEWIDQMKGLLRKFQSNSVEQQAKERAQQESIRAAFEELTEMSSKLVTLSLSLVLQGRTLDELERRTERARAAATGCGNAQLQDETWTQPQAFLSTLPSGGPYELRRKGVTSRNAGDMLPFFRPWGGTQKIASVFQTPGGDPFRFHPFCTSTGLNVFHSLFVADTGSGKSFTMGALLTDAIAAGVEMVAVDDGHSWQRLTEVMGGVHVPITLSSSVSPFVQYAEMLDEKGELAAEELEGIVRFIEVCVQDRSRPAFDTVERNAVAKAIAWCYETRLRARPDLRPLIGDFDKALVDYPWEHVDDRRIAEDLHRRLDIFTTGLYRDFLNRPSTLRMDAPVLCFEMSGVGDNPTTRAVAMATIMQAISTRAKKRRVPTIVPIDEFHKYVRDDNATARFFEYRWRVARKYQQAMWAASQDIGVLLANEGVKQAVVGNSPICWFLRHFDKGKCADVVERFDLSPRAQRAFLGLEMKPGHYSDVMLKFGALMSVIRLSVTPLAYWLLTTHGDDNRILERAREKNPSLSLLAVIQALADRYPHGVVGA